MTDLPAPDPVNAPYTGYRRAHWEHLADRMLLAARRYGSPGHALIDLPGPSSASGRWSDGLEGYARTFLLAAFRVAGADGADPHGLLDRYAEGLAAGVDPASPERWPTLPERRQARVEAASVAIALHETRRWLWDLLDDRVRNQVVDWLSPFLGTSDYDNNWIWFQNIAEAFLRSVGGPWLAEDIQRNLDRHDGWYVGNGWYSDGDSGGGRRQNFDYYSGWAMHFYPLWYHRILGEPPDPVHRERLSRYLADARHLVGAEGRPLIQGRSLTYRFAMLAPFWTGALFDATPLRPGETRRLASGVLRHFVDAGAPDADGLLPIGWHGAFPRIRQTYTGPGSPYWASKAFAGLLLPEGHPVWTATEEPLPVERADSLLSLRGPGWVVSATTTDGIVRVANHGSDHLPGRQAELDNPFYLRHAYSTHTAPDLSAADLREPVDSHVALLDPAGRLSHRGRIERAGQGDTWASSHCRPMWLDLSTTGGPAATWYGLRTGPWLTTASILRGPIEVRLVRVGTVGVRLAEPADAGPGSTGSAAGPGSTGSAVGPGSTGSAVGPGSTGSAAGPGSTGPGAGEDPEAHWHADPGPWRLHLGGYPVAGEQVETTTGADWARVTGPDGLVSAVHGLHGFDRTGTSQQQDASPLGHRSAVPWLRTAGPVRSGDVFAAAVVLAGGRVAPPEVTVRIGVDSVTVRWSDGNTETVPL
ncbi:DUF2264 domain-containing protein [Micromonospora sp. NPDC047074]|uniref:DUF2264 domain-containing protein n=1 Tax=Micromonospora sp. NPDC047074 TaxID=3154339 RepID=UPI0033D1CD9E